MLHSGLFMALTALKGRGMFTREAIPAQTVIEVAPVIVLNEQERALLEKTVLNNYIFSWGKTENEAAVGLGYSSIYNHASPSNCEYVLDYELQTITVMAMRDINSGEELTINYSASWNDYRPVWFKEA